MKNLQTTHGGILAPLKTILGPAFTPTVAVGTALGKALGKLIDKHFPIK